MVDRVAGGERGCRGLTPRGVEQAEALRLRLRFTGELAGATALLASTLPRAVETAQVIAPAFAGLDVVCERDLCEQHPGEGDGLSWEEFEARYGSFAAGAEPDRAPSPGGESWRQFEARVRRALHGLAEAYAGGLVVVVCHGGVVNASIRAMFALDKPAWPIGVVQYTGLTEWLVRSTGPQEGGAAHWALARFNDSAHLDDDGTPRRWR